MSLLCVGGGDSLRARGGVSGFSVFSAGFFVYFP